MPLECDEGFVCRLQRGNRVQIPVLVRWRHKLEPLDILRVHVRNPSRCLFENLGKKAGKKEKLNVYSLEGLLQAEYAGHQLILDQQGNQI